MKTSPALLEKALDQTSGEIVVLAEEDIRTFARSKNTGSVALKDADDDCDCVEED